MARSAVDRSCVQELLTATSCLHDDAQVFRFEKQLRLTSSMALEWGMCTTEYGV